MSRALISRIILPALTIVGHMASAHAGTLPRPMDKTVLTISGNILEMNVGDSAQFDLKMLEALGLIDVETSTPWYRGKMIFQGVPLQSLMDKIGAKGERIVIYSLKYETTEMPMSDVGRYHPIIALKRNGIYMPIRDKGPICILYPFDGNNDLNNSTYYERSVWSVEKMIIK